MGKAKDFFKKHKITSAFLVLVILAGFYWGYTRIFNSGSETRYMVALAEKGTLITSISGSGQVSASNQVDLKPGVSGDVIYIGVRNGQEVGAGSLIVQLDSQDAQKTVRDAESNLQSAKIAWQKLKEPADALSLIQAENALLQANDSLKKSYDDGFNSVSNALLDLPGVMTGLQDILYGLTINNRQDNISAYTDLVKNYTENVFLFRDDAAKKYKTAREAYDQSFSDYKSITRFADVKVIEGLVSQTYDTTKAVAEAVKSANDLLNFVKDELTKRQATAPSYLATHQNSLATYTSQTNTHLANLFNGRSSITNYGRTIAEKTEALAKLKKGADDLDLVSQELTIKQRENALQDAKDKLADYYVRAPFSGTIAKLSVKNSDSVSSGTAVATLVTRQKLAEISLNEIDVAKIKVGQQVTLTFDAVEGLSTSGKVAEIDTVGTVSQGVVTYNVKISFDTQDERVKPGMSASAAIITEVKPDVLLVPNSAVKTQNNSYYIEMFEPKLTAASGSQGIASAVAPEQIQVEIGLANDTQTEILNGIKERDQIVTRTVSGQTTTTANTTPSLFGSPGGNRGSTGGGAVRISR